MLKSNLENTFGFGNLQINNNNAVFDFIDSNGVIIHSEKIGKRSVAKISPTTQGQLPIQLNGGTLTSRSILFLSLLLISNT